MSHYSVLVAIPGDSILNANYAAIENRVEAILAPYLESTEDAQYLSFEDCTEQCEQEYETKTVDYVRFPDGTECNANNYKFRERFTLKDGKIYCAAKKYDEPLVESEESKALVLLPKQPMKDRCSFVEYCEDYCGYHQDDEGHWGYFSNPNAKWDWFEIGGRWSGPMLAKKNLMSALYASEFVNDPTVLGDYQAINGAFKKDIAWNMMQTIRLEAETKKFFKLQAAFLRKDASDLGPLTAIKPEGIYGWGELLYAAEETLEEYLERKGMNEQAPGGFYPYAYVDLEGAWHGQGDMGWFGLSSNDKPEIGWHSEVNAFIEGVHDDDYLVVVDCHI